MVKDNSEVSESALPPAHAQFSSHFSRSSYDVSAAENDDLAPFGTDEGSDAVHEWSERLNELRENATLRYMLGEGADELIGEVRRTEAGDIDDLLIGLGFTLLRYTGQIDREGSIWLFESLRRQCNRYPGAEYDTLLADLEKFVRNSPTLRSSLRATDSSTKSRRPWLKITGSNNRQLESWFRTMSQVVAEDAAWQEWWSRSQLEYLIIHPSPVGAPDRDITTIRVGGRRIEVAGSSAELTRQNLGHMTVYPSDEQQGSLIRVETEAHYRALIMRLIRAAGDHLGLGEPPPNLPNDKG